MYCSKCEEEKEAKDFYFSKGVISKPCKQCRRVKANERIRNLGREEVNRRNRESWAKKYKKTKRVQIPDWVKKLAKNVSKRSKLQKGKRVSSKHIMLMYAKQKGKCYYTGIDMIIGDFLRKPSVDRLNSTKDYTTTNSVLCCCSINLAKNSSSEEEFIDFLEQIRK